MSRSEDATETDQPTPLGGLDPGDQVLVATTGGKFDYDQLPATALENLLVLSVGRSPKQIQRALEARNANPRRVGVVPISGSSVAYDGPMWTSSRVSPMDFTGISIEFNRGFAHLPPETGWVLVDSVSVLLMYADVNRVYRLVDSMVGACRERGVTGVYVVDENAVTEETMNRFTGLFDRVVR